VTREAKVGDWVRFQRDRCLVVGVVTYVRKDGCWPHDELITDAGAVNQKYVLEVRGPEPAGGGE